MSAPTQADLDWYVDQVLAAEDEVECSDGSPCGACLRCEADEREAMKEHAEATAEYWRSTL